MQMNSVTKNFFMDYTILSSQNESVHAVNSIGHTVMALCNISPEDRVCNGTRAILTRATKCVLEICVMSDQHNGKKAFIICKPSPRELPFVLEQRQFPVCLCFGKSINNTVNLRLFAWPRNDK